MAEDRGSKSLEAFWQSLSPEQMTVIKAIAMDVWTPYIQATIKCVPDAGGKIRKPVRGISGKFIWNFVFFPNERTGDEHI